MSGKRFALVIGVSNYKKLMPLKFGDKDARDFAAALQAGGYDDDKVLILHDDDKNHPPERAEILHNLGRLKDYHLDKDDMLVFYFSGHGMMQNDTDYLLPIDASDSALEDTALNVDLIVKRLQETGSRQVVMFIDACRDELPTGKGVLSIGANSKSVIDSAQEGLAAIFSCEKRERSFEIEELQQSSFTYCLLQATKDPTISTIGEIASFLSREVMILNNKYGMRPQRPYLYARPNAVSNFTIFARLKTLDREQCIVYLTGLHGNDLISSLVYYDVVEFLEHPEDEPGKKKLIQDLLRGESKPEQFQKIWELLRKYKQPKESSQAPMQIR